MNDTNTANFEVVGADALAQMERASIDMQITTARRYPRDLAKVKREMLSFATLDEETAAGCFYNLGRQGKAIQGPSVRLAEIAISCFGNIRAASRVISNDGKTVTAQGVCHDLQNNVLISVEVKRRITDKNGNTYSEDMQVVTGNAACAIAFRNAAFKVVPAALIKPVYERARQTAVGDIKTLTDRRTGALKYFASLGVNEAKVLAFLSVSSVENITLTELEMLIGLTTAIKEGSTTVDDAFGAGPASRVGTPPATEKKEPAAEQPKAPADQQQARQKPETQQSTPPAEQTKADPEPEAQQSAPSGDQRAVEPVVIPEDPAELLSLARYTLKNADIDEKTAMLALRKLKKCGITSTQLSDVARSGLVFVVEHVEALVKWVNENQQ